jgi:hypothetical protein
MKPTKEEVESEWLLKRLSNKKGIGKFDWIRLLHTTVLYARDGKRFRVTIEYIGEDTGVVAEARKKK